MADFALEGYPLVKISFQAERVQYDPVIQPADDFKTFLSRGNLSGDQEVPVAANTNVFGRLLITWAGNFELSWSHDDQLNTSPAVTPPPKKGGVYFPYD